MAIRPASSINVLGFVFLVSTAPLVAFEAPKVVELSPANGATDIDPATKELRVSFDQDMNTTGHSICGGGPAFPKLNGRPSWKDPRTLVIKVDLEPDHSYSMSLNCPAAQNFRSAAGEPLAPTPWSFSTASNRKSGDQRGENRKSLDELMTALRNDYSYYDRLRIDWRALEKKHQGRILAARSTSAWVARVAEMLKAAKDLHLWMTYGGTTTGTYQRKVRDNFNLDGVKALLPGLTQRNKNTWTATTDDKFAYVLIPSWSADMKGEIEELQSILHELADAKAMIVDVRPNGGGDELLARSVAAWFVMGTKVYSKNCYRDAKGKGGFGPILDRPIVGNEPPNRFDKPVAVLMGPRNMSSCESFLLMMRQGEHVTLIGAKSFGSSGNPKSHKLSNGVEVFIPSWKDMQPDGSAIEGKGIRPDIRMKTTPEDFKTGDPVLARALEVLRKK